MADESERDPGERMMAGGRIYGERQPVGTRPSTAISPRRQPMVAAAARAVAGAAVGSHELGRRIDANGRGHLSLPVSFRDRGHRATACSASPRSPYVLFIIVFIYLFLERR